MVIIVIFVCKKLYTRLYLSNLIEIHTIFSVFFETYKKTLTFDNKIKQSFICIL